MSINASKFLAKANALSVSLEELELKLEQLFSQPLPDTAESLDHLRRAKLHVLIPYLIDDLIFVYIRTRGIDPKTHPVIAELNRVRQYFSKVSEADKPEEKATTNLDRAAAGRFIKHAISSAMQNKHAPSSSTSAQQVTAGSSEPGEPGQSSHVSTLMSVSVRETGKMRERARYQRDLMAESDEEEETMLDVIEDATENERLPSSRDTPEGPKHASARDIKRLGRSDTGSAPRRKKRNVIDPFKSTMNDLTDASSPSKKRKKSESMQKKDETGDASI